MSVLEITRLTFLEARMRKMLWAILLLGAAFLILYAIGFHLIYADIRAHLPGGAARLPHAGSPSSGCWTMPSSSTTTSQSGVTTRSSGH